VRKKKETKRKERRGGYSWGGKKGKYCNIKRMGVLHDQGRFMEGEGGRTGGGRSCALGRARQLRLGREEEKNCCVFQMGQGGGGGGGVETRIHTGGGGEAVFKKNLNRKTPRGGQKEVDQQ